jgi:putative endopeptidase
VIDGTTGDQRFYLGWAQVWRRNYREPNLRQRLLTDPHSPSEQRVRDRPQPRSVVSGVQRAAGQKLYLAPADRVRIW